MTQQLRDAGAFTHKGCTWPLLVWGLYEGFPAASGSPAGGPSMAEAEPIRSRPQGLSLWMPDLGGGGEG